MHEVSIAESILDSVQEAVGPGKRLLRVNLVLGVFSGVCADSLEFCFAEIARGRGLGNPVLEIATVPMKARCTPCGAQYALLKPEHACPDCGAMQRDIEGGFECHVESATFEDEDEDALPHVP